MYKGCTKCRRGRYPCKSLETVCTGVLTVEGVLSLDSFGQKVSSMPNICQIPPVSTTDRKSKKVAALSGLFGVSR